MGTCVDILSSGNDVKVGEGSYLVGKMEASVAQEIRMERIEAGEELEESSKMVGKVGSVKIHCKDQLVKVERHAEESGPEQLYLMGEVDSFAEKLTAILGERLDGFDVVKSEDCSAVVATPNTQPEASFKLHVGLSLLNNRVKMNIRSEVLIQAENRGQ